MHIFDMRWEHTYLGWVGQDWLCVCCELYHPSSTLSLFYWCCLKVWWEGWTRWCVVVDLHNEHGINSTWYIYINTTTNSDWVLFHLTYYLMLYGNIDQTPRTNYMDQRITKVHVYTMDTCSILCCNNSTI